MNGNCHFLENRHKITLWFKNKRSIVRVNAGKEENEFRARIKGENRGKRNKKGLDNERKVLKYL